MYKLILGSVALIIAACAAFFSVQGIANLYSDKFLAVCIMATGLEIGKLVAATYLHKYWRSGGLMLKTYLISAVAVLMAVTSIGIFGFLTAAYQRNFSQVELVDTKQEMYIEKKKYLEKEIESLNNRIMTLNEARALQEKRLTQSTKTAAKPIYEDIERAGNEIQSTRGRIEELNKQLLESSDEVISLKTQKTSHHDIGTLQFVASAIGMKVEHLINWFTLIIVLVFDPLALCLVLAYNNVTAQEKKEDEDFYRDILNNSQPVEPISEIKEDYSKKRDIPARSLKISDVVIPVNKNRGMTKE